MDFEHRGAGEVLPDPRLIRHFPLLMEDGQGELLAYAQVGEAPFSLATLLEAYSKGYFAWTYRAGVAGWFTFAKRGVLDFEDLHLSKSLQREMRKHPYTVTFNQAFEAVVRGCAAMNRRGEGTWIRDAFIPAYTELHRHGHAHSVEVWQHQELVGGLYGVFINGVFSGESMFHRASGASKLALLALIDRLSVRGITWMDTQMVTAFPGQIGAKYISYSDYLARLAREKTANPPRTF